MHLLETSKIKTLIVVIIKKKKKKSCSVSEDELLCAKKVTEGKVHTPLYTTHPTTYQFKSLFKDL